MPSGNTAEMDDWVHGTFGKHPNDYLKTAAGGNRPATRQSSGNEPASEPSPTASSLMSVANPYAGTTLAFAWEAGFVDGADDPNGHPKAPSPYADDAVGVYAEGVLAGQDAAKRGPPNHSEGPRPAPQPAPPPTPAPAQAPPDSHIVQILKAAAGKVGGAAGEKLLELATPASVAMMLGFMGLFVAAQWTPAGWAADGILIVTLVASAALIGRELSGIVDEIRAFVRLANDPNGDVDEAATHLANAVAAIGVDVILAILLHKAGAAAKPYLKPPTGFVDMVTPQGQIIRVPVDALPENAMASKGGGKGGTPDPAAPKPTPVPEAPDPAGFKDALAKGDMPAAARKLGTLDTNAKLDSLAKLKPDELGKLHDATVKELGADSPAARMSDPVHRANVEFDPDQKANRPNERDTALRGEQKAGVKLERYKPEPGKKGDWVDASGKVYDGCSPPGSKYFDGQIKSGNYERSLSEHVNHPNVDVVVVDVTNLGLTPAQMGVLDALVAKYGAIKPILRIP